MFKESIAIHPKLTPAEFAEICEAEEMTPADIRRHHAFLNDEIAADYTRSPEDREAARRRAEIARADVEALDRGEPMSTSVPVFEVPKETRYWE